MKRLSERRPRHLVTFSHKGRHVTDLCVRNVMVSPCQWSLPPPSPSSAVLQVLLAPLSCHRTAGSFNFLCDVPSELALDTLPQTLNRSDYTNTQRCIRYYNVTYQHHCYDTRCLLSQCLILIPVCGSLRWYSICLAHIVFVLQYHTILLFVLMYILLSHLICHKDQVTKMITSMFCI